MAPSSRARRNPLRSAPPGSADPIERDDLASTAGSFIPSGATAQNDTAVPTPSNLSAAPAPAPALGSAAPGSAQPPGPLTHIAEDVQKITKLYMDYLFQAQAQVQAPAQAQALAQAQAQVQAPDNQPEPGSCEQPLEACPPDLYFGKSHMECYHFCQQCEDHFDTAGATGSNRTPFAASFLRGRISVRWHQHKRRVEGAVPLSWVEFKAFLRKNLGDSQAFVDTIWSNVMRESQYQQEEVQDWASYLEHLRSISLEFNADRAPRESDLIRFFREGLKPSVKAQMEQSGRGLDSWEVIVEKAVKAEAKAGLQPPSIVREMDQCCLQGNRPDDATMMPKFQANATQDPRDELPNKAQTYDKPSASFEQTKAQDSEISPRPSLRYLPPFSLRSENAVESSKKKSRREKKKQYRHEPAQKVSTPATRVSARNGAARTGTARNGGVRKDLRHITCFNCDKKGHYADKCPEPRD